MKLNGNFKLMELGNVEREPRVLVSRYAIRFNKPMSQMLDYTEHVKVYVNDTDKMIAIVPCEKNTPGATKFYRPKNKKCKNPAWSNKRFINLVSKLAGWDLEKNSVGLYPQKLSDGGVYFEFSEAKAIKPRG